MNLVRALIQAIQVPRLQKPKGRIAFAVAFWE